MIALKFCITITSFLLVVNAIPHRLEEDSSESKIIIVSPNYLRQVAPVGGVLGALGTALVPLVGSLIGPILANLAAGITQTFNNGLNNGNNASSPRPTSPPRRPNRRPQRPARPSPHLLDIPTDGLPEFEGFMIRFPGVNNPYLLLAPPGSDLPVPFKLPGDHLEEERENLEGHTTGAVEQVTAQETSDQLQPALQNGSERNNIKIEGGRFVYK